tara:strand:+ start:4610 stop:5374 length:765 start_codon:yes stop_codon:yes gene_type:complete
LIVQFLGTGTSQGIPVIGSNHPVCLSVNPKDKRLRVSVLISWDQFNYVIDCGPDFRAQMLAANPSSLEGVIFTHEHADHTAGLDDIRPFFFRQGAIPIYAHKRVLKSLKKRFGYIFNEANKYPGAPSVVSHRVKKNNPFNLNGKQVIPINAKHNTLQVFGYRIDRFAYLTDIKTISALETAKLSGLEVLVVNALREEPHYSHFNLEEAIAFAQRVGAKKTYFTHISHHLGFHNQVALKLPENIYLAYDSLTISI